VDRPALMSATIRGFHPGCPGRYTGRLGTMAAPCPYRPPVEPTPAAGHPVITEVGDTTCLGALFVHLPLRWRMRRMGWFSRRAGIWRTSTPCPHSIRDAASVVLRHRPVVNRCKLGFRQYSFRHARLTLTLHAANDFGDLGLFRTCYFPPLLSEFQSLLTKVSSAGMSHNQQAHPLIVTLPIFRRYGAPLNTA
jgi:hypothetical protein